MSRFTQPLIVKSLSDSMVKQGAPVSRKNERQWILENTDFAYEIGELGSGELIEVRKGFVTDLASVPKILWWFIPPFGLHARAAVIHDWLYRTTDHSYSRKEADRIFEEAMVVCEVSSMRGKLMFWAVRVGGRQAWNSQ